ncbi:hypothetical protein QR98_0049210 [Sarcoptes scabiei]|uniref:Uncharacterized protein n=1 Tax=Sarcoptes scabiei TaxID=52283 RepID=A0A132A742_SARSC|nr:hypothetical protein QR98_0049210 [Sarcoptes scabiei]
MERREETTRSSNGGARTPTTPTSYRKVKFNDESYENEFQQACSSLSNKDIDILPDPDLDNEFFDKNNHHQSERVTKCLRTTPTYKNLNRMFSVV